MENAEYNRLIYENRLDELANITNLCDLTRYKRFNKFLLEYLLEKNIHTTRMDSYANNYIEWALIYIKYNIIKPLVNLPLDMLLEKIDNRYLLDILVEKMNDEEKNELYQNIKYTYVWLYSKMETEIIDVFRKHGFIIQNTFIKLPKIIDKKTKTGNKNKKLNSALKLFSQVYDDCDYETFETYVEEVKRISKVDYNRAVYDLLVLIECKIENPDFKLILDRENIYSGEYCYADETIMIDKYIHGLFSHELSHMLLDKENEDEIDEAYKNYCKIRKKYIKAKYLNKIFAYIKDLHKRIDYMEAIFFELYYKEVNKQYGSFNKYCQRIYSEIMEYKPEKVIIDDDITEIYIDYSDNDSIYNVIDEIVKIDCRNYVKLCVINYYVEECTLENLLDAILRGRIMENDINIKCISGHSKGYFNEDKLNSFDECLADFYEIKSSIKSKIIIDKLIDLIGDELVELFEYYIECNRHANNCSIRVVKKESNIYENIIKFCKR